MTGTKRFAQCDKHGTALEAGPGGRLAMHRTSLLIGTSLLLWAPAALAQVAPSTLNVQPLLPEILQLNIEDVEANEPIRLEWSATHFGGAYRYELTYVQARTEENPDQEFVLVQEGVGLAENPDQSRSGEQNVAFVTPPEILDGVASADRTDRPIVVRVFPTSAPLAMVSSRTATWDFVFDTLAPTPPTITSTQPGDRRIIIDWTVDASDDDVFRYELVFCPRITATTTVAITETTRLGSLPCAEDEQETQNAGQSIRQGSISSDAFVNGEPIAVGIRGVDEFNNVGELSTVWVAIPREVTDFYELYRQEGGLEEGGFCFVATAAYGSYAHPVVQVLRGFRDWALETSPLGGALVRAYYTVSPPLADALAANGPMSAVARVLLVLVGLLVVVLAGLPLLALGALARRLVRGRTAAAAATVLALGLVSAPAEAARPDSLLGDFGIGLEFKGGPYLPAMGNPNSGIAGGDAFVRLFGANPNFAFRVGAEFQVFKGFGTVAIGGTFGYMGFSGNGILAEEGLASVDETSLKILPMSLVAIYRFDLVADRLSWFPLVPYVKGGLAYHVWWATNGLGEITRIEGAGADGGDLIGRGGKLGFTGTLGLSFLLNKIEPRTANTLFDATGVRGTYLFAEVEANQVDGFGSDGFDFSDVTWNAGLFLEF